MKETALHDVHAALGAKLVEFGGWHMPVQYGPILDEVRTVRGGVGLFDLGHMGRVHVRGPEAVPFLDSVLTNHVARIPSGAIRYSLLCNEAGGCLDDLLVYKEEDAVYLVVNAANTESDLAWLRLQAGNRRVEIDDETPRTGMVALQGPASQAVLEGVSEGLDLDALGYYKFGFGTVAGVPGTRISRTGYTGEDGFEVYFENGDARRVWDALSAAGEPHGLRPIGLGARDVLRLEAGMALYGHEIDEEHDPIQAGLSFGVSFREDKGDWIGREALLAVKAAPRRRLVGVVTGGPRVPRQGARLYAGEEEVGSVCSGAPSPTLEAKIASAYVQLGHDAPGTELEIDFRGKRQPCTVQDLPFYSRTRK